MTTTLSIITATHFRMPLLAERALPSILQQTWKSFEWVVINDGPDPATRELLQRTLAEHKDIAITYHEIDHADKGFGLCHARNHGLKVAAGNIVAYLDDDNMLYPAFVSEMLQFLRERPTIRMTMVRQRRRRDVIKDGQVIRRGQDFEAPAVGASIESLVQLSDIFDSNGFCHPHMECLRWNDRYRVFADYEFLLQCVSFLGRDAFALNNQPLVEYIQSSEGTIGSSNFGDWSTELRNIYDDQARYGILKEMGSASWLQPKIQSYREAYNAGLRLPGFSTT